MLARLLVLSAALLAGGQAAAQGSDPDKERLKRLLEEKFKPAPKPSTRSAQPPPKDGIYVIKPDGSVERAPPDSVRQLPPRSSLGHAMVASGLAQPTASRGIRVAQAGEGAPARDAPQVLVKRDAVVIQLKPEATEAQIKALVDKYNLRIIKLVPSLGVLQVELPPQPPGAATRSARPGDAIRSTLEPKLVTELRNEPAVDAAFVDVSVAPRSVPRPGKVNVEQGGKRFGWDWQTPGTADGNWGLKVMRMPGVWKILEQSRKSNPKAPRPVLSFLDNGFGKHPQLDYRQIKGALPPAQPLTDCNRSHGTHVAGIAGATFNRGAGIDGIVPDAQIDIIQISRELLMEGVTEGTEQSQQQVAFFMDAITDLAEYLDEVPLKPGERRVVNISLAYNWAWTNITSNANATADRVIRDQIRQHAKVVQYLVNRQQGQVLFVVAAGNDSHGMQSPVQASLATPFAFAALQRSATFQPSPNILVVEAHDRSGARASFSNVGGHVAAPGVDVLSTLASTTGSYGVCSGTSQAAPHVSALATILFELDPAKTPAEMIEIIRTSAQPPLAPTDGAPRVDGLEAALQLQRKRLVELADLNGDGKVDAADLAVFKADLTSLLEGRFGGEITRDLNGDGVVDQFERCWPRIDLNGSGRASIEPSDVRAVGGVMRSDVDVIEAAWTDQATTFKAAFEAAELDLLIDAWRGTASVGAAPRLNLELPCK